jgi:PilZ domain
VNVVAHVDFQGSNMNETRNSGRVRAILGAQIIFNNRNSTLDCQIRNISQKGARLAFSSSVSIPQEFELSVPQRGRTYRARLRWRDAEGAGVEFIDEQAQPASGRDPADLVRRVAELEAENAGLRLRLMELTQRLDARADSDRAA